MIEEELDADYVSAMCGMMCYDPDESDDDDTAEVDINDPRRRTNLDAVRCPCPPLEPYPPAGWMSLERWETRDYLSDFPGVQVDGCNVWVPDDIGFEVSLNVGFRCDKFRTAFTAGEWYLLDTRHN